MLHPGLKLSLLFLSGAFSAHLYFILSQNSFPTFLQARETNREIFERLRDLFEVSKIRKFRRKSKPSKSSNRYFELKDKRWEYI